MSEEEFASTGPGRDHPRDATVELDTTRVDRWLWAVRLYHSRSLATDACRGGHVRINGTSAKPASNVRVGDRLEVRQGERRRIVVVARVIDRRVGAPLAATCLVDHSPERPAAGFIAPAFVRDPARRDDRRKRSAATSTEFAVDD